MHLITDYPWYFLLLCVLLGVAYSMLLYFRTRRRFPQRVNVALAVLRGVTVTIIAALLLAPMVKRSLHEQERPIIVVAQDNSQSIVLRADSAFYRNDYAEQMKQLVAALEKDYEVHTYCYDGQLVDSSEPDYTGQSTDMAGALNEVLDRYAGRNVGALILTGDGIFNRGLNPVSVAERSSFPIYTVALGDTTVGVDAAVTYVRYNKLCYLGNRFPLEVTVSANHLSGMSKRLTVSQDGKVIESRLLTYNTDRYVTSEQFLIDAEKPGIQTYEIRIEAAAGELSQRNNTRTLTIEVIDGRQKIAIIAAVPHPDVAALRQSIESNEMCEVETFLVGDFQGNVHDYDLVVLHQLPAKGERDAVVRQVVSAKIPCLFVLGSRSDLKAFNNLHVGLEIQSRIERQNESLPVVNSDFTYFDLGSDVADRIAQMPPLLAPFGEYQQSPNVQSLITARVGNVNSDIPLIACTQQGEVRYVFVAGEGLWRWRMMDYQYNQTHDNFNALIRKLTTYASTQIGKDRFRVVAQSMYDETAPVTIEAELYDANYELVNKAEVSLTLRGEGTQPVSYNFNPSGNRYVATLGHLSPGNYRYEATTQWEGKPLTAQGSFVVERLHLEDLNLVADYSLMNTLATLTGGAMLMAGQTAELPQQLQQRDDIKSVVYTHTRYSELLNVPWLLIMLLVLLGVEWGIRKYHGEI